MKLIKYPAQSMASILFDEGDYEKALRFFDSYNTQDARSRVLDCLYALGRIGEILERLSEQVSRGRR